MQITWYVILNMFLTVLTAFFVVLAYKKRKQKLGKELAISFVIALVAILSLNISLMSLNYQVKIFFNEFKFVATAFFPVCSIVVYAVFLGLERYVTKRNILLLCILPTLTVFFAWTNLWHLFRVNIFVDIYKGVFFVNVVNGPWFWVYMVYTYLLLLVSFLMILREYFKKPVIYREQTFIMIVAYVSGIFISGMAITGVFMDYGDITVVAFISAAFFQYYGIMLYKPRRMIRLAREQAFNDINNEVVIFDRNNKLLDANINAMRKFHIKQTDFDNFTFEDFAEISLGKSIKENVSNIEISLDDDKYNVKDIMLYDATKMYSGRAVVFSNVTKVKSMLEEMEYLAQHDYLTGMLNGQTFANELKKLDKKENFPISILCFNIYGELLVNTIFSSGNVDWAVMYFANVLKNSVAGSLCAVISEHDFVMALPKTNESESNNLAIKIIDMYKDALEGEAIEVSYSVGVKSTVAENLDLVYKMTRDNVYRNKFLQEGTLLKA